MAAGALSLKAGYKTLEGSHRHGKAFRTPLVTLHKFQGWADKFLYTPDTGVEDVYLNVKYRDFSIIYHQFRAETGGGSLGNEIDFAWFRRFGARYSLLLKYADYRGKGSARDTRKAWLVFTASF